MITAKGIEVTLVGADWQVGWPDGYRLVFRDLDVSRPRVFAAETVAYYGDHKLLAQTIDALRSHDRRAFREDLAGVNGLPPANWDERIGHGCELVREAIAMTGEPEWPARAPLPALTPEVPTLPDALLPLPLHDFVHDVAERMQVPTEYVAIPVLVILGSLIGRQCGILPKRKDDWLVIPNLWGAIVGRSGLLKSPSALEALKPLERLVLEATQAAADRASRNALDREVLDAQIAGVKEALKKAAKEHQEDRIAQETTRLQALQAQLEALTVTARRFKTSDPTIQKLGELLRDNPYGLLLYRDELSGWLSSLGQEGRAGDREFFLETWNGDGSYTFDRIGRGEITVTGLCLSVLGGIQPGKIARYVYEASEGGAEDDGLLQRLQLLVWPAHDRAWVNIDRYPDSAARTAIYHLYARLAQLDPQSLGATVSEYQTVPAFRFHPDAQDLFDAWRTELEIRLRSDETLTPPFESHLAKYRSLMPSLALIFHLVDALMPTDTADADGQGYARVSLVCAQRAAAWCEFLEAHARKVYAGVLHKDRQAAHALAEKIQGGAIVDGQTVRDIYRNAWALLRTPEDVQSGLLLLERHGWVRVSEQSRSPRGGRPTEVLRLHPDFRASTYA
jgi:Protein of unknown function (DUF3987)